MKLVFPSNRELMNNELVPSTLNILSGLLKVSLTSSDNAHLMRGVSLCMGEGVVSSEIGGRSSSGGLQERSTCIK